MLCIRKENGKIVYKPENWKERICIQASVKNVGEECCTPRLYLPVRRNDYGRTYECWIIPLAPIVILFYIYRNCFRDIWVILMKIANK